MMKVLISVFLPRTTWCRASNRRRTSCVNTFIYTRRSHPDGKSKHSQQSNFKYIFFYFHTLFFFFFLTVIYIDSYNFHIWGNLLASPFNKGTQNNPCILYICVASLFLMSISNPIPETINLKNFIQCLCFVSAFHYSAGHSPVFIGPNTLTSSNETGFLLSRTFRKHPT